LFFQKNILILYRDFGGKFILGICLKKKKKFHFKFFIGLAIHGGAERKNQAKTLCIFILFCPVSERRAM
jgi:hypothetical protein